jgi:hypothetical protein
LPLAWRRSPPQLVAINLLFKVATSFADAAEETCESERGPPPPADQALKIEIKVVSGRHDPVLVQ